MGNRMRNGPPRHRAVLFCTFRISQRGRTLQHRSGAIGERFKPTQAHFLSPSGYVSDARAAIPAPLQPPGRRFFFLRQKPVCTKHRDDALNLWNLTNPTPITRRDLSLRRQRQMCIRDSANRDSGAATTVRVSLFSDRNPSVRNTETTRSIFGTSRTRLQ